jgi:hypothetical protein
MLVALIDLLSDARTILQNVSSYFLTQLRMCEQKAALESSLTPPRRTHMYHELAKYIFQNNAELSANWLAKPQIFVAATQHYHNVYAISF